jgi:hypothetical protein
VVLSQLSLPQPGAWATFLLASPAVGRYLVVRRPVAGAALTLCEMQAYGAWEGVDGRRGRRGLGGLHDVARKAVEGRGGGGGGGGPRGGPPGGGGGGGGGGGAASAAARRGLMGCSSAGDLPLKDTAADVAHPRLDLESFTSVSM